MSCPWIENREKKDEEKSVKYGPLRWSYKIDTLDIHSTSTILSWTCLGVGQELWQKDYGSCWEKKTKDVLRNMQKSVVSSTLNIARVFKIIT